VEDPFKMPPDFTIGFSPPALQSIKALKNYVIPDMQKVCTELYSRVSTCLLYFSENESL